jgi:hypothetical protein
VEHAVQEMAGIEANVSLDQREAEANGVKDTVTEAVKVLVKDAVEEAME